MLDTTIRTQLRAATDKSIRTFLNKEWVNFQVTADNALQKAANLGDSSHKFEFVYPENAVRAHEVFKQLGFGQEELRKFQDKTMVTVHW